jgi:hypothetical protein
MALTVGRQQGTHRFARSLWRDPTTARRRVRRRSDTTETIGWRRFRLAAWRVDSSHSASAPPAPTAARSRSGSPRISLAVTRSGLSTVVPPATVLTRIGSTAKGQDLCQTVCPLGPFRLDGDLLSSRRARGCAVDHVVPFAGVLSKLRLPLAGLVLRTRQSRYWCDCSGK